MKCASSSKVCSFSLLTYKWLISVTILLLEFQRSQYPDHQEISRLAKYFKVEPCRIQVEIVAKSSSKATKTRLDMVCQPPSEAASIKQRHALGCWSGRFFHSPIASIDSAQAGFSHDFSVVLKWWWWGAGHFRTDANNIPPLSSATRRRPCERWFSALLFCSAFHSYVSMTERGWFAQFWVYSLARYLPRHSPRSSHTWPSPPRDRSCRLMRWSRPLRTRSERNQRLNIFSARL